MWGIDVEDQKLQQMIQIINDHSVQLNIMGAWAKGHIEQHALQPLKPELCMPQEIKEMQQKCEKMQTTLTDLWTYVTKRLDNIETKIGIKIGGEIKWK